MTTTSGERGTRDEARRLRIGVLGCGPISQMAHFDATRKARNAELYAICDVADDLVDKMCAIHAPRKAYVDFDAMLADAEVEAVIVGVADPFHVALSRRAIAAGKHVLVEKPMGVTVEECEALRDEVHAAGRVLQVGNNRRFDPGIAFAKKFIDDEIGDLVAVKAAYCDSTYRYVMTDNLQPLLATSDRISRPKGNPKADKRRYFLMGHGSHVVDTLRFLGGDIEAVRARLVERFGAYCWFADVEYAKGHLGHLDLSVPIRGDFEETFRVYGERGSIDGHVYLPWFHKSSVVECFSATTGQFHRPLGEDAYTYKLQIEGFADAILNGAPQWGASADDGVAAMRALAAIARSVESGDRVRLADVSGGV